MESIECQLLGFSNLIAITGAVIFAIWLLVSVQRNREYEHQLEYHAGALKAMTERALQLEEGYASLEADRARLTQEVRILHERLPPIKTLSAPTAAFRLTSGTGDLIVEAL